jgi:hypothetical protein
MPMLIPKGESLVTYYILPMVGVNKLSFGRSFVGSYISKDGANVYVELAKNMHVPSYRTCPNYVSELMKGATKFITFNVPVEYTMDIKHFLDGAYSKFQNSTKKIIYSTSSLPYNATKGSFKVSSPILQALDKTKTLRSYLEDTLGITRIPETNELIDPPKEEWFIEHRIKNV